MQNSGESEFSNSNNAKYTLSFWQNFMLTLAGAAGLISMVADGPRWITYTGGVLVIGILFKIISSNSKKK
jgi:hypothetical protein